MTNPVRRSRDSATTGFTLIELLVVIAIIAILIALLVPAIQKVREAANRSVAEVNMKTAAWAAKRYHDAFGVYPANVAEVPPTWRVHILPHIEQGNAYRGYKYAYTPRTNGFGIVATPQPLQGDVALFTDQTGVVTRGTDPNADARQAALNDIGSFGNSITDSVRQEPPNPTDQEIEDFFNLPTIVPDTFGKLSNGRSVLTLNDVFAFQGPNPAGWQNLLLPYMEQTLRVGDDNEIITDMPGITLDYVGRTTFTCPGLTGSVLLDTEINANPNVHTNPDRSVRLLSRGIHFDDGSAHFVWNFQLQQITSTSLGGSSGSEAGEEYVVMVYDYPTDIAPGDPDGASNCFRPGQVVPWYKPQRFGPSVPQAVLGDGSVRFIRDNINLTPFSFRAAVVHPRTGTLINPGF